MLKLPLPYANLTFLMTQQAADLLRELPSVDRLLNHPLCGILLTRYNRGYIAQKCREILDQLRGEIRANKASVTDDDAILSRIEARVVAESRPGLVRVVNA